MSAPLAYAALVDTATNIINTFLYAITLAYELLHSNQQSQRLEETITVRAPKLFKGSCYTPKQCVRIRHLQPAVEAAATLDNYRSKKQNKPSLVTYEVNHLWILRQWIDVRRGGRPRAVEEDLVVRRGDIFATSGRQSRRRLYHHVRLGGGRGLADRNRLLGRAATRA